MKAGIYQCAEYSTLYYVAKDRTVMAASPNGGFAVGCKVNTQRLEQWATLGSLKLKRVSDVPNGCTDHAHALSEYLAREFMHKNGPKDVRLAWPELTESKEMSEYKDSVKDVEYVSTREELLKHQHMLSSHPPAVQTPQPDTDVTLDTTETFSERAAEQVDTVVQYEHAKKELQLMLMCEQEGIVRWAGDDWEIVDLNAWNLTHIAPSKILPVLPHGWVAERAAQYIGNARANSPIDRGLKAAMAVLLGEPRLSSGGYTGQGVPGERPPGVLPSGYLIGEVEARVAAGIGHFGPELIEPDGGKTARGIAERYGSAMPQWATNLPVGEGAASFVKAAETYTEEHARHIVDGFRMQFQQADHLFNTWREYEFRMVLAHIVEVVERWQDEVLVLNDGRFITLEADVREGRYKNIGTHVVDTHTGKQYPVSLEQRAIIKHLLDAKPNYTLASGLSEPLAAYVGDRRYRVLAHCCQSDDPAEREAIRRIRAGEIRLIGKQSKRKHKRAGRRVFWCAPMRSWAWEVGA